MSASLVDTVLTEDFSVANDPSGWRADEYAMSSISGLTGTFSVASGKGRIDRSTGLGDASKVAHAVAWKDLALEHFDVTFASESFGNGNPDDYTSILTYVSAGVLFSWNGTLGSGQSGYLVTVSKAGTNLLIVKLNTDGTYTTLATGTPSNTSGGVMNFRVQVVENASGNLISAKAWATGSEPAAFSLSVVDSSYTTGKIAFVQYGTATSVNTALRVEFDNIRLTRLPASVQTGPSPLHLTSGADTTNQQTYTTASVTPTAGRTWLLAVEVSHASAVGTVTPTGLGLTWTEIDPNSTNGVVWNSTGRRLQVFLGTGTPSSGTISLAVSGTGNSGAAWVLLELDEQMTTANVTYSAAAAQAGGVTSRSVTGITYPSSTAWATIGFIGVAATANTVAPNNAYITELAEVNFATPTVSLQAQWNSSYTPVATQDWTWTTAAVHGTFVVQLAKPTVQTQAQQTAGLLT